MTLYGIKDVSADFFYMDMEPSDSGLVFSVAYNMRLIM